MISVYNAGDKTFGIKVSSKLTKEDYQQIVPKLEEVIKQFGRINLLLELEDFESIEPAALWEDLKFDVKHRDDFKQIAIVGDKEWVKWSANFSEIFFDAQIKYFEEDEVAEAWRWLGVTNKIHQF